MVKVSDFDNFGVVDMSKEEFLAKEKFVLDNCKCAGCPSYVAGDAQAATVTRYSVRARISRVRKTVYSLRALFTPTMN